MFVLADNGHFSASALLLSPSARLRIYVITNKPDLFRATDRLPVTTTLGMLRNEGGGRLSFIK